MQQLRDILSMCINSYFVSCIWKKAKWSICLANSYVACKFQAKIMYWHANFPSGANILNHLGATFESDWKLECKICLFIHTGCQKFIVNRICKRPHSQIPSVPSLKFEQLVSRYPGRYCTIKRILMLYRDTDAGTFGQSLVQCSCEIQQFQTYIHIKQAILTHFSIIPLCLQMHI